MDTNLKIKEMISHFGGQAKTAGALNVTQPTVSGWLRGKHGISAITALKVERITAGKFLATDLCPGLSVSVSTG